MRHTNLERGRIESDAWKDVHDFKMEAFLGCLMNLGAMRQCLLPTRLRIRDRINGNNFIRATMGETRFKKVARFLCFDDKASRSWRKEREMVAPLREIWDMFNQALKRHYVAGPFLRVDEQLVCLERQVQIPSILVLQARKVNKNILGDRC